MNFEWILVYFKEELIFPQTIPWNRKDRSFPSNNKMLKLDKNPLKVEHKITEQYVWWINIHKLFANQN